jgi:hypothetical protein
MCNSKKGELRFWCKIAAVLLALLLMHGSMLPFFNGSESLGLYKFSGPPRKGLVLGISRVARAIQPEILNKELDTEILNFGIDLRSTSYGDIYLEAVKRRLDSNITDGVFILSVEPWSISCVRDSVSQDLLFPEENSTYSKLWTYEPSVNFEYLIRDYKKGWGNLLITYLRNNSKAVCHKDGWIDLSTPVDSNKMRLRKNSEIKWLKDLVPFFSLSDERKKAFESLIEFLNTKGEVYLIRLPIDDDFYNLENNYMPNFNSYIDSISARYRVPYYEMQSLSPMVIFNDGHHLNRDFAPFISQKVADWIELERTRQK